MSILLACNAAMAVAQVTSTISSSTSKSLAMALPMETMRPLSHCPVAGFLEYHGGAWVTPMRSLPVD